MQRDLAVLAPAATLQQRMNAFTQNDADKNGKLTKEEYAGTLKVLGYSNQLEEYWLQRDVNKDGFISVEEYVPAIGAAPAIQLEPTRQ
jgi:EF hand